MAVTVRRGLIEVGADVCASSAFEFRVRQGIASPVEPFGLRFVQSCMSSRA